MKPTSHYRYILLCTFAASLGGFLYGYDTAVVSGAIGFLKIHFQLSPKLTGWAVSCLLVGAIIGSAGSGFIGDRYGRKWSLFGCALLFGGSSILSACANSIVLFTMARFIGGIAIGATSMLSPLYLAEISPKQMRGRLVSCYQLAIVAAICLVFFINIQVQRIGGDAWNITTGWRWMFASSILPAGLFAALLLMVGESPRWLMKFGRRKEAKAVLENLSDNSHAQFEFQQIEEALQQEDGRWSELFTTGYRRALLIGILLSVFAQLSGINAIMYYASEIFKTAGETSDIAYVKAAAIGLINLLFTFVAMWFVDRAGRKPLLLTGTLIQAGSLFLVGFLFQRNLSGPLLLIAVLTFVAAFAATLGPITWIVNSEIFPNKLRGRCMSLAILALWVANFLVTQTFPILNQTLGAAYTFWIYGFFSLLTALFALILLPETKGRTLEEIERYWLKQN